MVYRDYQINIANNAKDKNALLPTALGKTIISLLVAADKLYYYSNKKILVLAPTKPLVIQHKDTFARFLKIKDIAVVTGSINPIYRKAIWDKHKIYFATPEVVRNDLMNDILSLKDFSLIVFDEAHRAVKDYAYVSIANYLEQSNGYILALTASPSANIDRIKAICNNLAIEHIEYRTEDDEDVIKYINPLKIDKEFIELSDDYKHVISLLKDMLDDRLKHIAYIINKPIKNIYKKDIIDANKRAILKKDYAMIMNCSIALSLYHSIELLESQSSYSFLSFIDRIKNESKKST